MTRVNNYSKQITESVFVSTLHQQMLSCVITFFQKKKKKVKEEQCALFSENLPVTLWVVKVGRSLRMPD